MKILVGIKMVPKHEDVRFVAGINRIEREGVTCETNPLDRHALRVAVSLARSAGPGASVVAFTMGPPHASLVLDEALAHGADSAVHLLDLRFAGADTLATARTFATLVERERPDLVVLGRFATDGATAQVAPQLAALAGLPVVVDATSLSLGAGTLSATVAHGDALRRVEVALPAVAAVAPPEPGEAASVTDGRGEPVAAAGRRVEVLDADALGGDDAGYGIRGSATYVQRIDPMPAREPAPVVTDPAAAAATLRSLAASPPSRPVTAPDPSGGPQPAPRGAARELWAVGDPGPGGPHRLALETVACARGVAGRLGAQVVAVSLGDPGPAALEELAASGADRVLVVRSGLLGADAPGGPADPGRLKAAAVALGDLVAARAPLAVVGPWTPAGRVYVPQAAARATAGCSGDVVGLDTSVRPGTDDVVDLVWLKPAWSGTAMARVVARTPVAMGTLRPCAVAPHRPETSRRAPVEVVEASGPVDVAGSGAVAEEPVGRAAPAVPEDAAVVVCVGTRFDGPVDEVLAVAGSLGWAVGATPGAVALGLLPPGRVLDSERYALSPWLAVGVGVADPLELAPLAGASTLVVVDPDKGAALHALADVGIACRAADVFDHLARG